MPALTQETETEWCGKCRSYFPWLPGTPKVCTSCMQKHIGEEKTCSHGVSLLTGCATCQRLFGSNHVRSYHHAKAAPSRSRASRRS